MLNTVRKHARISWELTEPALHSVLYREKGAPYWRRQYQPHTTSLAWLLLPDLQPHTPYEIQAVSEFPDGRTWRLEAIPYE